MSDNIQLKIEGSGQTDVGMVRQTNQDAFLVDNNNHIYIVADGMGGHAGGEIASFLCATEVHRLLKETVKNVPQAKIFRQAGECLSPFPLHGTSPQLMQVRGSPWLSAAFHAYLSQSKSISLAHASLSTSCVAAHLCIPIGIPSSPRHLGDQLLFEAKSEVRWSNLFRFKESFFRVSRSRISNCLRFGRLPSCRI